MRRYVKKPETVTVIRWYKNGDHPLDNVYRPFEDTGEVPVGPREGAVVRYFCDPAISGRAPCKLCQRKFFEHGFLDKPGDGQVVCPGDYIVTDEKVEHSGWTQAALDAAYAPVPWTNADLRAALAKLPKEALVATLVDIADSLVFDENGNYAPSESTAAASGADFIDSVHHSFERFAVGL